MVLILINRFTVRPRRKEIRIDRRDRETQVDKIERQAETETEREPKKENHQTMAIDLHCTVNTGHFLPKRPKQLHTYN